MAEQGKKARRPRIRKAPTIREQNVIARAKAEKPGKKSKAKSIAKKPFKLLRFLKIPSNPLSRALGKFFRPILRPLKFIGRWIIPRYFINSFREVRLVAWPGRRESWRLTGAVFIFAIIFGAMVALLDKGLDVLFKQFILK